MQTFRRCLVVITLVITRLTSFHFSQPAVADEIQPEVKFKPVPRPRSKILPKTQSNSTTNAAVDPVNGNEPSKETNTVVSGSGWTLRLVKQSHHLAGICRWYPFIDRAPSTKNSLQTNLVLVGHLRDHQSPKALPIVSWQQLLTEGANAWLYIQSQMWR